MSPKNLKRLAGACALAIPMVGSQLASASVLLFNFGGTTVSSAYLTDSPAYTSGAWTSQAATTWNSVGDADIASGLKYYDGSAATGVAIGVAGANGTGATAPGTPPSSITFGGSSLPGGGKSISSGAGVFAAGTPANGADYQSSSDYTAVGANITGLASGTYAVYVVGQNYYNEGSTTGSGNVPDLVWINSTTVAPDPTSTAYAIPSSGSALYVANTEQTYGSWVLGTNFVKTTVTISASTPALTIVTQGDSATEQRAFLNAIEIVPVATPEPASLSLFLGSAGLMLKRKRRNAYVV